jgi:hypothetical protein
MAAVDELELTDANVGARLRAHHELLRNAEKEVEAAKVALGRLCVRAKEELGMGLREIGEECGVAHTTARRWMAAGLAVAGNDKPTE